MLSVDGGICAHSFYPEDKMKRDARKETTNVELHDIRSLLRFQTRELTCAVHLAPSWSRSLFSAVI